MEKMTFHMAAKLSDRCEQILMRAEKLAMVYLNLEGGITEKDLGIES